VGEKLAVAMASLEPGAAVSAVARGFDVTRRQVCDGRRAARRGDLGMPGGVAGFVEVVAGPPPHRPLMEAEAAPLATGPDRARDAADIAAAPGATVETVPVGGRVPRTSAGLPTAEPRRLVGGVEGA